MLARHDVEGGTRIRICKASGVARLVATAAAGIFLGAAVEGRANSSIRMPFHRPRLRYIGPPARPYRPSTAARDIIGQVPDGSSQSRRRGR